MKKETMFAKSQLEDLIKFYEERNAKARSELSPRRMNDIIRGRIEGEEAVIGVLRSRILDWPTISAEELTVVGLSSEAAGVLADFILEWLESRNGAELRPALEALRVGDARRLREELALILRHGGRPPNWTA